MEWLNSFWETLTIPAIMLGIVLGFLLVLALWGKSLFGFLMGKHEPSSPPTSTTKKKQLPKNWGKGKWLLGGFIVVIFAIAAISTVFFIRGCGDRKPTQVDFKQQTSQSVVESLKMQYGPQSTADLPQSELDRDTRGYIALARWEINNGTLDNVEKWLKIAYDSLNQNSSIFLRSEITQLTGLLGALRLRAEEEKVKSKEGQQ